MVSIFISLSLVGSQADAAQAISLKNCGSAYPKAAIIHSNQVDLSFASKEEIPFGIADIEWVKADGQIIETQSIKLNQINSGVNFITTEISEQTKIATHILLKINERLCYFAAVQTKPEWTAAAFIPGMAATSCSLEVNSVANQQMLFSFILFTALLLLSQRRRLRLKV